MASTFIKLPLSGGGSSSVTEYPNFAAFPPATGSGNFAWAADTNILYYDEPTSSTWISVSAGGSGDVTAALALTDNALVRGDGGAKGVQTSGILIDDSDNISGMSSITTSGSIQAADITLTTGNLADAILDEDNMISDSDSALATQQSIKAYVDSQTGSTTLQSAYEAGEVILVDAVNGTITFQDAATPVSNLFKISNNALSLDYFSIASSAATFQVPTTISSNASVVDTITTLAGASTLSIAPTIATGGGSGNHTAVTATVVHSSTGATTGVIKGFEYNHIDNVADTVSNVFGFSSLINANAVSNIINTAIGSLITTQETNGQINFAFGLQADIVGQSATGVDINAASAAGLAIGSLIEVDATGGFGYGLQVASVEADSSNDAAALVVDTVAADSGNAIGLEITDNISSVSGSAFAIRSLSTQPSTFGGSITATEFTGGNLTTFQTETVAAGAGLVINNLFSKEISSGSGADITNTAYANVFITTDYSDNTYDFDASPFGVSAASLFGGFTNSGSRTVSNPYSLFYNQTNSGTGAIDGGVVYASNLSNDSTGTMSNMKVFGYLATSNPSGTVSNLSIFYAPNGSATGASGTVRGLDIQDANFDNYLAGDLTVDGAITLGSPTELTKQIYFAETTLADGANISWDLDDNQTTEVTLAGNRTLDNPTNKQAGSTYILKVTQDGTGSRTLAYGSEYKWAGGVAPVLSTAAGAIDIITFYCDGTNMYGSALLSFS